MNLALGIARQTDGRLTRTFVAARHGSLRGEERRGRIRRGSSLSLSGAKWHMIGFHCAVVDDPCAPAKGSDGDGGGEGRSHEPIPCCRHIFQITLVICLQERFELLQAVLPEVLHTTWSSSITSFRNGGFCETCASQGTELGGEASSACQYCKEIGLYPLCFN